MADDDSARQLRGTLAVHVRDPLPPEVTASVYRRPGGSTDVRWSVTDPESGVISGGECGPVELFYETVNKTYTCVATSIGGTTTKSVTVSHDATPPTIAIKVAGGTTAVERVPTARGAERSRHHALGDVRLLHGDRERQSRPEPDRHVRSHGPGTSSRPGPTKLTCRATDNGGNVGSASVDISVAPPPR